MAESGGHSRFSVNTAVTTERGLGNTERNRLKCKRAHNLETNGGPHWGPLTALLINQNAPAGGGQAAVLGCSVTVSACQPVLPWQEGCSPLRPALPGSQDSAFLGSLLQHVACVPRSELDARGQQPVFRWGRPERNTEASQSSPGPQPPTSQVAPALLTRGS